MDLYLHHRRKLIWLHWVAASTAGAGTVAAVSQVAAILLWPTHSKRWLWITAHGVFFCVLFHLTEAHSFEKFSWTQTGMFVGLLFFLLSG